MLAALAAVGGMAVSRGLTAVSADRSSAAEVVGDNQAFATLSGFGGNLFPLSTRYTTTGSVTNRAGSGAQVSVGVDPNVLVACRGGGCGNPANWTLYVCWSWDTAPAGTNTCGGGRQQVSFYGSGPVDPAPLQTGTINIPSGSPGYILARVTTNASRFCARVYFAWSGAYGAAGGFLVADSPGAPRFQIYWKGSATC